VGLGLGERVWGACMVLVGVLLGGVEMLSEILRGTVP